MNLKTAARRLGVHYQTAYKWVRSGELIAVKVGLSYEISEAALERFVAEREAQKRVPEAALARPLARKSSAPLGPDAREQTLAELDEMLPYVTVDARVVFDRIVARATETIGDSVVLRLLSEDRRWAEPVAFGHPEPALHVIMGAIVNRHMQKADEGFGGRALTEGRTVYLPQVSQRQARRGVPQEFVQHLDNAGIYSAIVALVCCGGGAVGTLSVHRNHPGNPYTPDDVTYVEALARRASAALTRAELFERAWRSRADVKARLERELVGSGSACLDAETVRDVLDAVDGAGIGLVVTDLDHRVVAVTAVCAGVLGYRADELVGMSCLELTADDDLPEEKENLARLVRGELDYCDVTMRKLRRDGTPIPLAIHRAVVRTPDGTPHYVVAAIRPSC